MADAPDLLAAELTAIGDRAARSDHLEVWTRVKAAEEDRDRLLAGLLKVLELAHPGPIYVNDEAVWDWALDPSTLREAITRELLGEGKGHGG